MLQKRAVRYFFPTYHVCTCRRVLRPSPCRWAMMTKRSVFVCTLLLWPTVACAHLLGDEAGGFVSGFKHPLSGLDHVVAMVSVGLWGAQLGAPAIWLLPVAFPMVMAFGGMLGLMG